ncbi:MAG: MAC/perforin domain-containing protein [bacterium]|nr:MAC/perforin domain-containing protein [bacterium]
MTAKHKLPEGPLTVFLGNLINIHTGDYLDVNSVTSTDLLGPVFGEEYSEITVGGKIFSIPQFLANHTKYFASQNPMDSDWVERHGRNFASYFSEIEGNLAVETEVMTFETSLKSNFAIQEDRYSDYFFHTMQYRCVTFECELDVESIINDSFVENRAENPVKLVHIMHELRDRPEEFFAKYGTHVVSGLELGGTHSLTFYSQMKSRHNEQQLKLAISAEKDSLFGGSSSYSAEVAMRKIQQKLSFECEAQANSRGVPVGEKQNLNDWSQAVSKSPALISYNSSLHRIHSVCEDALNRLDRAAGLESGSTFENYATGYRKYCEGFIADGPGDAILRIFSNPNFTGKSQALDSGGEKPLPGIQSLKLNSDYYAEFFVGNSTPVGLIGGHAADQSSRVKNGMLEVPHVKFFHNDGRPIDEEITEIRLGRLADKAPFLTIFKGNYRDYSKLWYSTTADIPRLKPYGFNNKVGSFVSPPGAVVVFFRNNDYKSDTYGPFGADMSIDRAWSGSYYSSLKIVPTDLKHVQLFAYSKQNAHEKTIALPQGDHPRLFEGDVKKIIKKAWGLKLGWIGDWDDEIDSIYVCTENTSFQGWSGKKYKGKLRVSWPGPEIGGKSDFKSDSIDSVKIHAT